MSTPVFILGTGRCGSTLISNLFNTHPHILSISEFFTFITDLGTLIPEAFPEHAIDGGSFWHIISKAYAKQNCMIQHDIAISEVLYPYKNGGEFNSKTGIPAILQTTLPHLSTQHDALFHELQKLVCGFHKASIQDHYRKLFGLLAKRFDKKIWAERSGGSLRIAHRLYELFPDARFVHIVRDGRDCALSMQRHNGFKMALVAFQLIEVLGVDPFESDDRTWLNDLPDELIPFLPERFNGQAFRDYPISPSLYGHYWSGEITAGLEVWDQIGDQQKMTLKYEDILAAPNENIAALIEFIDPTLCDLEWQRTASKLVKAPTASWRQLSEKEQSLLTSACAIGLQALQHRGITW